MLPVLALLALGGVSGPSVPAAAASQAGPPPTVLLWVEGEVHLTAEGRLERGPAAPVELPVGTLINPADGAIAVGPGGRAVFLSGGGSLVEVTGPLRVKVSGGRIERVSREPWELGRLVVLGRFTEGPAILPPPVSHEPRRGGLSDGGLRLITPRPSGNLPGEPRVAWRFGHEGGRFDLTLYASEDGEERLVESWRGLSGRSHVMWAELVPGARYRVTLALAGAGPIPRVLEDAVAFWVLDDAAAPAVVAGLKALADLTAALGVGSPAIAVLRARLFERFGMFTDAQRVWSGLALLHPRRPELIHHAYRLERLARAEHPR